MRLSLATVRVARAVLDPAAPDPWVRDICRRTGHTTSTVTDILERMRAKKWLTDEWRTPPGRKPHHHYQVTAVGRVELGSLLAQARNDERFKDLFPAGDATRGTACDS